MLGIVAPLSAWLRLGCRLQASYQIGYQIGVHTQPYSTGAQYFVQNRYSELVADPSTWLVKGGEQIPLMPGRQNNS